MNHRSYTVMFNRAVFLWQVWHNHAVVFEATTKVDAERFASAQG